MIEPVTALSVAKAAALQAESSMIKGILDNLSDLMSRNIGKISKSIIDRTVVSLQIGFKDYLKTSYNRCRMFKTLLNPNLPLDIVDNYVHVTLTCGSKPISDTSLISNVQKEKFIVVTGLAGSGKSMFMKYLTIMKFHNPDQKIPLFVDLRHINQLTHSNLLTFVRSYCGSKLNNISEDQFELALKTGALTLVLDGFDEINYELRDTVQKQIIDVSKDYPNVSIIVSSRPDNRFGSWSSFYVYKVDKLSKSQCIALVKGLHYEKGVRDRFLKEVKARLYESHESFLSSPLLTTIMLLTFEEFADIPDKMHAFYSQAFDTLFQRHDAQKDQFQRKTHTGLTREEFRACFATFSAMSYLDQKFSFGHDDLIKTAGKAVKYARQKNESIKPTVTAAQFVEDLTSSVCMLHQDGLEIAFVHRSFQEYFAALFVVDTHGEKTVKILDRYALRFGDSVISMALEMDRENIEQDWVLPTLTRLNDIFFDPKYADNVAIMYSKAIPSIGFHRFGKRIRTDFEEVVAEVIGPFEILRKTYHKHFRQVDFPGFFYVSLPNMREIFSQTGDLPGENSQKLRDFFLCDPEDLEGRQTTFLAIHITPEDNWWMSKTEIKTMFEGIARGFMAIRKNIETKERKKSAMLKEFFE